MTRISKEIYEKLMREGVQSTGANQGNAGMKDRESAGKRSIPESAATSRGGPAQMTRGGVQTTMSKSARYTRNGAALLMLVVSDVR